MSRFRPGDHTIPKRKRGFRLISLPHRVSSRMPLPPIEPAPISFCIFVRASLPHKDYGNACARSTWRATVGIRSRNLASNRTAMAENGQCAARDLTVPRSASSSSLRPPS